MEEKTYTLNIRQIGKFHYEVTVPEIGAASLGAGERSKSAAISCNAQPDYEDV